MPRTQTLAAIAPLLADRGWTHLDARCALDQPDGIAWTEGSGLVLAWGRPAVVHAIELEPFGPTSRVLADVVPGLPARLELRAGPAAGGILIETHRVELLAPMRRFVHRRPGPSDPPKGLVPLAPDQADAVRAIPDADAPLPPPVLPPGWLGVVRQGELVAATGPVASGPDTTFLAAPRLAKAARDAHTVSRLLSAAVPSTGTTALDLRVDRRDRRALIEEAGFEEVGVWERWWCVRRDV